MIVFTSILFYNTNWIILKWKIIEILLITHIYTFEAIGSISICMFNLWMISIFKTPNYFCK